MAWAQRIEAGLGRLWWRAKPSAAALGLLPLAWCYASVSWLRRAAFQAGWLESARAPVPVLVVGNLVVGGAGKTPTVIALVGALRRAGWTPGVISRGYGRQGSAAVPVHDDSRAEEVGDEPLLIRLRTRAPVWVARRRIEAACALCAAHAEVDVLVCDDGLQHLHLARDVQVIVFDERGIGNGLQLPAGPLRQALPRHVPVNTHVLYNAAAASTKWPGATARRALAGAVLLQDWWRGAAASLQALHALRGRPLLAAAGMAAPQRFFDMLRVEGLHIDTLPLSDHFAFDRLPWPAQACDVLVTEKDAVKLPHEPGAGTRIWVVALDFQLPEDFIAAVLHNLRLAYRP
ncbi:MAG TPA: tetraacyldisaccharide 4'-kinase [Rubrivivax sp.]|nr:tetraacyldisaccharide 4'-kinase [Rubrivivax sp.]